MKNIAAVAETPMVMKAASRRFFAPAKSAKAPSAGEISAMIVSAIVVAQARRARGTPGGRPAAAIFA